MSKAYAALVSYSRETALVRSLAYLAGWDQETYMPDEGATLRGDQKALLARLEHERMTSPRMKELLAACEQDPDVKANPVQAASIRDFRRDLDLACKLPADLVAEIAGTSTAANKVWREARAKSDFSLFAPWLDKMIGLTRRKAECYGTPSGGEPYDALLNEFEPGATARDIEQVFTPLRDRLSALVKNLGAGNAPDESPTRAEIPAARQHEFGLFILKSIGFDLAAGRLDVTTHPFCQGMGPGDTRLTTRYRESRFTDALYGTLHEAGHGMYEQGLPKAEHFGAPLADAVSLGIHESQSRLWENWVGRSQEFWTWAMPHAKRLLGTGFGEPSPEAMYRAVNTAKPSFIRVEADEATYNMHVMVRFEIERALFRRDIEPRDVPALWNRKYQEYLGVTPPDDARGCLQDVHWSAGLLGYFPTYTLGNLYMAQFMEKAAADLPGLRGQIALGAFAPLLGWLRDNIHRHGRRFQAAELCQRVTGKPLSADPLMRYLEAKLRPIYGR